MKVMFEKYIQVHDELKEYENNIQQSTNSIEQEKNILKYTYKLAEFEDLKQGIISKIVKQFCNNKIGNYTNEEKITKEQYQENTYLKEILSIIMNEIKRTEYYNTLYNWIIQQTEQYNKAIGQRTYNEIMLKNSNEY